MKISLDWLAEYVSWDDTPADLAAAVAFSSFVALSLSSMLASKVLPEGARRARLSQGVDWVFGKVRRGYHRVLLGALRRGWLVGVAFVAILGASLWLLEQIPDEYAPKEDRGVFYLMVTGPEGASYKYIAGYMTEIERRMMPLVESGEIQRLLVRAPRAFGNFEIFNTGIVINVLSDWSARRSAWEIMDDVRKRLADLPGVRVFPLMRQGFGARIQKPVQFVIGGGTYQELAEWRDTLVEKINAGKDFVGDAIVVSVGAQLTCESCDRKTLVTVEMDQPVSDETLAACREVGEKFGAGYHIHVAEGPRDADAPHRLETLTRDDWLLAH